MECTGAEKNAAATKCTLSTFNLLRKHADFESDTSEWAQEDEQELKPSTDRNINFPPAHSEVPSHIAGQQKRINLSYTINLNLPATKDIEVFHAIFKSLKQHLLDQ